MENRPATALAVRRAMLRRNAVSARSMKAGQREFTFLVRMWWRDGIPDPQWRGSVHEVSSGKRRFISETTDIAEFITAYLRGEHREEPSQAPFPTLSSDQGE